MRRRQQGLGEISSHPFRSLFDLMVALVFLLIAALVLRQPKRQQAAGFDSRLLQQELLFLHNLKRREESGPQARLMRSLSELPPGDPARLLARSPVTLSEPQRQQIDRRRSELWKELGPTIEERMLRSAVRLRYSQEALHFPSGSDIPDHPERLQPILEAVSRQCDRGYRRIRVEGHTDNVPIANARFRSNWELSAARAIWLSKEMEKYLNARGGSVGNEGVLIEAIGYGERNPLPGNDNETEAHRRLNRRIELVFEK